MASHKYTEYIHHSGLNKSCVITADGPNVLEWKKKVQLARWDEQYQRKLEHAPPHLHDAQEEGGLRARAETTLRG